MPDRRLRPLDAAALDSAQRGFMAHLTAGPRGRNILDAEGRLDGPFDALLRVPVLGRATVDVGTILRYEGELSDYQRELAVLVVTWRWGAVFSWTRHKDYARRAGLTAAVIDAIAAGTRPEFGRLADEAVYDYVHDLVHCGQVGDAAYAAARNALGEQRLVELTVLAGYYTLTSFILNAYRVPAATGPGLRAPGPA